MSEEKKRTAIDFVTPIVEAQSEQDAIDVIVGIGELLGISESYTKLQSIKIDLDKFNVRFKSIRGRLEAMSRPYVIEDLLDTRLDLSLLLSELVDSGLVYEVNKLKIFFENRERGAKSEAFMFIKSSEELMKALGSKSIEAVKTRSGDTPPLLEWNRCNSAAYGNFTQLRSTQSSIEQVIHSVSSLLNSEITIQKIDAK